ncbi:hypothetical protein Hbl1158_05565 [Halobaculum sp. CBA1158]|uniref:DUF7312 domain-containing protein n=1 Tax=Halobaculum sp. CBA1158 TaxID=2904243 RepID=UPI001F38E08F|nr:hypothetical protein [Halobaculum sp. CBA1158]UIP00825.1 hypothetical protein Hbl1158_05565 [Halobaculum sp. CBA1158]
MPTDAGRDPNAGDDATDAATVGDDADDAGDEWRFALDEVGPDAEPDGPERPPIEPESVDAENALFVVAGVLGTLLFVLSVTL